VDVWILLDVQGSYWFWPSWIPLDQGVDHNTYLMAPRSIYSEDVLRFSWPQGIAPLDGLYFHGAAFRFGTFELVGEIQSIPWRCL